MPLRVYEGTLTHMLKARDIENTGIDISSFLYEQIKPLFPDAEHVDLTCGENLYNASIYMTPQKVKDQRILSVKLNKECLTRAMLDGLKPGDRFFDLGCGSGILSILAARLGAGKVIGVDISDVAIVNARENVEINKVADQIEIKVGSVEVAVATAPYDFLVANILKNVVVELFDRMYDAVRPGGIVVLSGLLEEEQEDVLEMVKRRGNMKYRIIKEGEWIAVEVVIR